ncbi:hypothetical protein PBY51_003445 [Eleginops maclovinus]|uniref:Uncharacterized protein n=1 Tax=Eleginops maclovinus TaxID=56733 RepID=A0AAN8AWJ9_ELEMC|nr:hypothetical protein PBY51_003445 [Eleginops maclovinus]
MQTAAVQEVRKSCFEKENSSCSHSAASQLRPQLSGGGGKYLPLCTIVLLGLQAPPAGEEPGSGGEREGGERGWRGGVHKHLQLPKHDLRLML